MERCVIEFHGFKGKTEEEFVIKELALVSENNQYTLLHFHNKIDKSSLEKTYRRTVTWLEKNYHFIDWEYGTLTYSDEMMRGLCSHFKIIYTKGLEKKKFLSRFHNNVKELPLALPKLKVYDERLPCPAHSNKTVHCALQSGVHYMELLKSCTGYYNELDRLFSFIDTLIPPDLQVKYAKNGFYFNREKDAVLCVWCENNVQQHTACVKYYVHNIPIEFSVFIKKC